jgi:hypothetical protein
VKNTPEGHPDHATLPTACEKIENMVTFLNEKKRDKEALQRVVDVCRDMEGLDETTFVIPSRRFVL